LKEASDCCKLQTANLEKQRSLLYDELNRAGAGPAG